MLLKLKNTRSDAAPDFPSTVRSHCAEKSENSPLLEDPTKNRRGISIARTVLFTLLFTILWTSHVPINISEIGQFDVFNLKKPVLFSTTLCAVLLALQCSPPLTPSCPVSRVPFIPITRHESIYAEAVYTIA
nr:hypothetical protein Iba_chr06bCG4530 [Ipomoea batatas]